MEHDTEVFVRGLIELVAEARIEVKELTAQVEEARSIAKKALFLLREMPVGLDDLDPDFFDLPDWTEK